MAIQDAAPDAHEHDRVRYRPSLAQQAPFALLAVASLAMGTVGGMYRSWPLLALPVLLALEFSFLIFGIGITLTPTHAVVHNLRRRKIKWADIQGVTVETYFGSRTVVLHRSDGKRVRLRAPITGFLAWDRRFDEKFHTIGQWWLAHRGTDWAPGPQSRWAPWVRPTDRPRLRPAAAQAVPLTLLFAVLGAEFTLLAFFSGLGDGPHPSVAARIVGGLLLVPVLAAIWQFGRHGGVTLTPDHLDVHNLRRRKLPWSEVEDVEVRRTRSGTRIVIRERSGRQTRLSSPRVGLLLWDEEFADKAWAIHRCWQNGIGTADSEGHADDGTVSSASFLQLGGGGNPPAWKRALVIVACVVLAYELFVNVLVLGLFAALGS